MKNTNYPRQNDKGIFDSLTERTQEGKIFRFLNYVDLPANIGARLRVYNLFQVIDCKILKILTAYSSLLKRRIVTHYEETKVRVIVFVVLLTTDPNKHL